MPLHIGPKIEPMVVKGNRAIEFPSDGPAVITRKAITTLLGKKKAPDVMYILNCVLLSIIDGRETRACLLLHIAFSLPLPANIKIEATEKIPDLVGSLSAGLLKKRSHYSLVNRIFLQALDKGMESICVMIGEAGFPKSFDDPIFTATRRILTRSTILPSYTTLTKFAILPSYLILAIALGKATVVKMMLSRGSNLSASCWLGLTPLLLAPCGQHPKSSTIITRLLLEAGADPRIPISQTSLRKLERMATILRMEAESEAIQISKAQVKKIYPLDMAASMMNCDVVILLLNEMLRGGRVDIKECRMCLLTQMDLDITVRLIKMGADVEQTDAEGNTPLHIAARYGKTEIVAVLLHSGASLNARNIRNW